MSEPTTYLVKDAHDARQPGRLIVANSRAQLRDYLLANQYTVTRPSATEAIEIAKDVQVEYANQAPAKDDPDAE